MIDESFLTTEEVLEYLQVNLRTVYRLIKAGKIPAVRVGRQWRFRKRDIDAWLESQRPRSIAAGRRDRVRSPAAGSRPSARARRGRRGEHPRSAVEDAGAGGVRRRSRARRPDRARAAADHPLRPADHRPEDAGRRRPHRHPRSAPPEGRTSRSSSSPASRPRPAPSRRSTSASPAT